MDGDLKPNAEEPMHFPYKLNKKTAPFLKLTYPLSNGPNLQLTSVTIHFREVDLLFFNDVSNMQSYAARRASAYAARFVPYS